MYWAKGREDEAWYGAKHLQLMTKTDFVEEAAKSNTGTAGAAGIWNGVPVVVNYVNHSENKDTPESSGLARFQFMEGIDETGKTIGHFEDLSRRRPTDFPFRKPRDDLWTLHSLVLHPRMATGVQLVH